LLHKRYLIIFPTHFFLLRAGLCARNPQDQGQIAILLAAFAHNICAIARWIALPPGFGELRAGSIGIRSA